MRNGRRLTIQSTLISLAVSASGLATAQDSPRPPNILFIASDDMNHWVRHLGRNDQARTPNIDRLARRGVTFTKAYCAAPVCNPSRAALLSGLRPSTSGVYDNGIDWRPLIDRELTLPTHFRKHGYYVAGSGKIYHGGWDRKDEFDDYLRGEGRDPNPNGTDGGVAGIRFAPLDCRDEDLQDYRITSYAIEQLNRKHDKPFFIACGLHKPHMPWNVPRKYYDMFPVESLRLPPVLENDLDDVPAVGANMARPNGDHAAILASGRWKEAVQAYLAAIAYADMNVGRLIDALDKSAYRDNTVIVFWGDHGWHLGEKLHWRKFALWEEATRAPLIWVAPNVSKAGTVCESTVDFMSIYPTLCELAGLPIPKHVEGSSILSLLKNPKSAWERPALTTYGYKNHAVRSDAWRYIRYFDGGEELYDEIRDPLEWSNLADKPNYNSIKQSLAPHLPKIDRPDPEKGLPETPRKRANNPAKQVKKAARKNQVSK